jgi:hypothetical protein
MLYNKKDFYYGDRHNKSLAVGMSLNQTRIEKYRVDAFDHSDTLPATPFCCTFNDTGFFAKCQEYFQNLFKN